MSSILSVNWGMLAGYTAASAFGVQSLYSAKKGLQNLSSAAFGSQKLNERVDESSSNIFNHSLSFCFGKDSVSSRFKHAAKAVENFTYSAISGLVAFILFQKGLNLSTQYVEDLPFSKNELTEDQANFSQTLSEGYAGVLEIKKLNQFIHFGLEYTPNQDCEQLLAQHTNPKSDELSASEAAHLVDCINTHILYKTYLKDLRYSTQTLDYLEKKQKVLTLGHSSSQNNMAQINIYNSKQLDGKETKKELTNYFQTDIQAPYQKKIDAVYDTYKQILKKSKEALNHHIETEATTHYGPFIFHKDAFCDKDTAHYPSYIESTKSDYCRDYWDEVARHQKMVDAQAQLSQLSPSFVRTNGQDEVFIPAIRKILESSNSFTHAQYGLTEQQFKFFKENF